MKAISLNYCSKLKSARVAGMVRIRENTVGKCSSVAFWALSFSEKSRDPYYLRSVQKYHVFQRFYGNSLESVSSKFVVTQGIKPRKFYGPTSKKTQVGTINSIKKCSPFFVFPFIAIWSILLVVAFHAMFLESKGWKKIFYAVELKRKWR